jgi:sarcosine oxidase gamma subunit
VTAELEFLSPDRAGSEAVWRSPLERALREAPETLEDLSRLGKVEVRGAVGELDAAGFELVAITPRRALALCDPKKTAKVRRHLADQAEFVVDMSAAYAGIRVRGETLMRRLTDLDLERLPAVGPLAHVQALVLRDDEETFRLFFPQEYGDYVAEVVLDALVGLAE